MLSYLAGHSILCQIHKKTCLLEDRVLLDLLQVGITVNLILPPLILVFINIVFRSKLSSKHTHMTIQFFFKHPHLVTCAFVHNWLNLFQPFYFLPVTQTGFHRFLFNNARIQIIYFTIRAMSALPTHQTDNNTPLIYLMSITNACGITVRRIVCLFTFLCYTNGEFSCT